MSDVSDEEKEAHKKDCEKLQAKIKGAFFILNKRSVGTSCGRYERFFLFFFCSVLEDIHVEMCKILLEDDGHGVCAWFIISSNSAVLTK